jgi:proton-dependent oligopeptide transporter, POT family
MHTSTKVQPRTFFGQPMALAYLSFTEAWERFSYYGMTSILVLYMSQALLTPGHVEGIVGFTGFRAALESVFGPMSTLALASQNKGLYTGLVYFTPVLGGWVADRWIGRRTAVMLGAVMMSAGHLAMAFDASFLLALFLLISGCGLLKGNISTQVGELYAETDGEGRTRAFAIFSVGINVGAVLGPLLVGLLAQLYGWHAGFGLAGALMLIGLITYIAGFRYLPADRPRATPTVTAAPLDRRQWRIVVALGVVSAITSSRFADMVSHAPVPSLPRSSGSLPRAAWNRHSASNTGTPSMLASGSIELNQATGTWKPSKSRSTLRLIQTRFMLVFW